jgi:hypothetical protein
MKKILLFILALLALNTTQAQNKYAYIKFENNKVLLQNILEEKGLVDIVYKFTNTGESPLLITKANTSTSRISIKFPRQPILPNKSGEIIIKYNPKKKQGDFNRTINIISNAKNRIAVLYIKGNVIPRPLTLKEQYPTLVGKIRYKRDNNRPYLGDVKNTQTKSDTIFLLNNSDKELHLEFKDLIDYVKVSPKKTILAPRAKMQFILSLDGKANNNLGSVYERLQLYINGKHSYKDDISLNARIVEDFSTLSEKEIQNAPKMVFENIRFKFGTLTAGESTKHVFYFKNEGKRDLIIRKIKASCGCTAVTPKANIIKAGKKSQIDVTFNSINKRGRQHKFIYVICNDPSKSTIKLEVVGNVLEAKKK